MNPLREQIPLLAGDEHGEHGKQGEHYLDNAATALMPRAVLNAVREYDDTVRGNVGRAVHRHGEAASAAYEEARREVAEALSTRAEQIVFTGGASAALNMLATALLADLAAGDVVLLSIAEHHSNIVPWQIAAARRGVRIRTFGVTAGGAADAEDACGAIARHRPRVVSVAHVTNVGGGETDIGKIAGAAKDAGATMVVDGAQYVPHQLPDLSAFAGDYYVFSGHKCYAPNGIGVLWGRALSSLPAVVGGGGAVLRVNLDGYEPLPPPHGLEAGTPPLTPAVGLAAAMRWMRALPPEAAKTPADLARQLRRELSQIAAVRLLFPAADEASPLVSFVVDGVHPHDVCEWLAARRVSVRGGHHCAQPLFAHLGIEGCVRASIAPYNDGADIDALLAAVGEAAKKLRR